MSDFTTYSQEDESSYAKREREILERWEAHNVFQKSVEKEAPAGDFIFYEGPPTANGRPGIHHLESRAFKDAIPRYKTMRGFRVRRKAGWDTHGLPVELQVEKELNLTSKKDIESYGIARFNEKCKESVWQYAHEWEDFTRRIGYWVDLDNAYVTYRTEYMETLWWILKHVADRDLLYKDYKVLPWCSRCGTGLSSHELALGYAEVKDLSVTAKFELVDTPGTYLLAWTTTPWTLPGNVGLAVHPDTTYVTITTEGTHYILAKDRLEILSDAYEIIEEYNGEALVGRAYKPLYPYLQTLAKDGMDRAYHIYPADFVTTDEGTGIVHTAVMYGQDDFELGTRVGLPKFHLVDERGTFIDGTDFLAGRFVKDEAVAIDIIKDLAHRGLLFAKEKYEHTYPHCWRCQTPIIYYARDSWYIKMSAIKDKLITENKKINWEPGHIRDGRFGEWLNEVKDWAISRERYWGTPLPVWEAEDGERLTVGSIEELKKYTRTSGNRYFTMRHGESKKNVEPSVVTDDPDAPYPLTEKGKMDVRNALEEYADEFDLIFTSPTIRTKETADMVAAYLELDAQHVHVDERIREFGHGVWEGKLVREFEEAFPNTVSRFTHGPDGGETWTDIRRRMGAFLYELEEQYTDKRILIISHGDPMALLKGVVSGSSAEEIVTTWNEAYPKKGKIEELDFIPLPHNEDYEIDLHRPYIDSIVLQKDGKEFHRVPEVMDVWFDSGAMPFAQEHYPFENKTWVDEAGYPADFISEAIDQTRGWFYTLHAIGVLLDRGAAYRNVICLGHILDEAGQKMSKSRGNTVDPWEMANRYGVDTLRFWMYTVNQPGESKNFDEGTVKEVQRKVFGLLDNVVKFYELYQPAGRPAATSSSDHVLDRWILARLNELTGYATSMLDQYKLFEPTRGIRDFIADLSQWYIRRSRDRFRDGDQAAYATTHTVLMALAKLIAPFAPFFADDMYQRIGGESESVHLESWPIAEPVDQTVLSEMEHARELISEALKVRQQAGLKVRQPLARLVIPTDLAEPYRLLIADEVNVKEVVSGDAFFLDCDLTEELKEEGAVRDLIRTIQDLRKQEGMTPDAAVAVTLPQDQYDIVLRWREEFERTVGARELRVGDTVSITKV